MKCLYTRKHRNVKHVSLIEGTLMANAGLTVSQGQALLSQQVGAAVRIKNYVH
jgi:hypothetical protein